MLRSDLIREQDRLIGLLYHPETATDEQKQLKARIDADRSRLNTRLLGRVGQKS